MIKNHVIKLLKNDMKRITSILIILMLTLALSTAEAGTLRGDVDQDGSVNITDVTALINYLLLGDASGISIVNADSNQDGKVNIDDVTVLIDRLLRGEWPEDEQNHDYVDLGLPSGTLWATCNVGASTPEDYGDYFAWGETSPKQRYDWDTYKWCITNQSVGLGGVWLTKYCTDSDDGSVDGKTELDFTDDAAFANWGPSWRMSTVEQQQELCEYTTVYWVSRNGVWGVLATGPNGNTIFLPASGVRIYDTIYFLNINGIFWSRTLQSDNNSYDGKLMSFGRSSFSAGGSNDRYYGHSVRPVRASQY